MKLTFQDWTSTCPCVHSQWPHCSTPAAFLKNKTLPRKRMKYIHVTIYTFPFQTNWKRHVKIIFLNFTYLSFCFHAAMTNRKRKYIIPLSVHYCHLGLDDLRSGMTHSVIKWPSEMLQCIIDRTRPRFTLVRYSHWPMVATIPFCPLLAIQRRGNWGLPQESVHMRLILQSVRRSCVQEQQFKLHEYQAGICNNHVSFSHMTSCQNSPLGYPAHQSVTLNHCLFLQQTKGSTKGLQPPGHMCYAARSHVCILYIL